MNTRDTLIAAARARAAQLAPGAGVVAVLSARMDRHDGRVALHLTGERVLKYRPQADAAAMAAAHRDAAARLAGHPALRVPQVLAVGADAVVLSWLPGRPLAERADDAAIRQAGGWLAVFHGTGRTGTLQVVERCAGLTARAVRSHAPQKAALLETLGALGRWAQALEGQAVPCAVLHGDLTPQNVLISPDGVGVIDFEGQRHAPMAEDIGRLWAGLLLERGGEDVATPLAAGLGRPLDGVARFHAALRLGQLWSAMPPLADMSPRRLGRFACLRAVLPGLLQPS